MINILIVAILGNLASFLAGAFVVGQFKKPDKVESKPILNNFVHPIEAIKDDRRIIEQKREAEKRQREFDIMMENIDNYDGTSSGQKEVV